MIVKDLIEKLIKLDPAMQILISENDVVSTDINVLVKELYPDFTDVDNSIQKKGLTEEYLVFSSSEFKELF